MSISVATRNRNIVNNLRDIARYSPNPAIIARMAMIAETAAKTVAKKKNKGAPDIDLRRKYAKYIDIKGVFAAANTVMAWVNAYMVDTAINPFLYGQTTQFSMSDALDKKILDQYAADSKYMKVFPPKTGLAAKTSTAKPGMKTVKEKIGESSVLVRLQSPSLVLECNPLAAAPAPSPAMGDDYGRKRAGINNFVEALDEFDKQLASLLGSKNYKMGRTMKLVTHGTRGRSIVVNMEPIVSPLMKFSEFSSSKGDSFTSKIIKETGIGAEVETANIPAAHAEMMEFEIAVDEDSFKLNAMSSSIDAVMNNPELASKLEKGTLTFEEFVSTGGVPYFKMELHVGIYIRYPLNYAMWATCAEKFDEFNPALFMDLHNTRVSRSVSVKVKGAAKTPTWMSGMNQVRDEVRRYERDFDHKFPPRVNEDNFVLTKFAQPMWVPEVDNTDEYMNRMRGRHDRETGLMRSSESAGLKNYPVFTDWKHNRFSYCNDSGQLDIVDLSGCSPLPPAFIYRSLDQYVKNEKTFCGRFWVDHSRNLDPDNKIFDEVASQFENNEKKYPNIRVTSGRSFRACYDVLASSMFGELKFMDLFGPWDDEKKEEIDGKPRAQYAYQYLLLEILRAGAWRLLKQIAKTDEHSIAYSTLTRDVRFGAFCLTKYSKNSANIIQAYQAMKESNRLADADLTSFIPEIANMPGLDFLQPHQIEVVGALDTKEPLYAIIDVAAGGGKTIIAIAEIIRLLQKGKIKRPLIFTKDNLVAEFMTEITTTAKGQINGVPITAAVVEQHIKNFETDAKGFVKWVKSFPPNTVFVAGYNFAKKADSSNEEKSLFRNDAGSAIMRNRNEIVYGNYVGSSYTEKFDSKSKEFSKVTAFKSLETFPMADLLVMCGFDYVNCDEAHYIKETEAQVTQAVNNVMATAKYRRWMSGTIVTNTAIDLVGIMSTLGVFGSKEDFKKQYMEGRALKPGKASEVLDMIKERAGIITKRRKDWAYIMPDIHEEFIRAHMTPLQQKFYKDLLEQALARFEKEFKKVLGKDAPDGVDVKDDGEEDDVSAEEAERILASTLTRLEVFVGAPDEDKPRGQDALEAGVASIDAFANLVPKPGPEDMVSPKVKILNKVLAAHFNGVPFLIEGEDSEIKRDDSKDKNGGPANKVVVLSYNKPLSRHVMRHLSPEFKKVAIRYVASRTDEDTEPLLPGREALEKFRKDPNLKVLIADVASMTEGFNLQMASRLIELQTVWSPGKMEQARARVVRPDPRQHFLRDDVSVTVIAAVCDLPDVTSVDIAKFCRIVTKVISKARLDYEEDPNWRSQMANNPAIELPGNGLKMSPKAIRELKPKDMIPFLQAYRAYTSWEEKQFAVSREKLKKKLEAKHGRTLTTEEVRKYALEPVVHAKALNGSKRVFAPYIYGQKIYDPLGLDLQSLIAFDSEQQSDDDDSENSDEGLVIEDGTAVWTPYGPGRVQGKPRVKSLTVDVPGLKHLRICTRGTTFVPSTPEGRAKLENLLRQLGESGAPTVDDDGFPVPQRDLTKIDLEAKRGFVPQKNKPKVVAPVEDETEEEDEDGDNTDQQSQRDSGMGAESLEVSITPLVVNGAPSLVFVGNPDDPQERNMFLQAFSNRQWREIRDFIGIKVPNYRAMGAWVKELNEQFRIKSDRFNYMTALVTQLKTKTGKILVEDEHLTGLKAFKNFYDETHVSPNKEKIDGKFMVKPWLITFQNSVFIAFDVKTHRHVPTLLQTLNKIYTRRVAKFTGAAPDKEEKFAPKLRDHWAIKFVGGVFDAQKNIHEIEASPKFSVIEYDETIEDCKNLAKRKKMSRLNDTDFTGGDDEAPTKVGRIGTPGKPGSPAKKTGKPGVKTAVKKKAGFPSSVKKAKVQKVSDRLSKAIPKKSSTKRPAPKPTKPAKPPSKPKSGAKPGKFGKR